MIKKIIGIVAIIVSIVGGIIAYDKYKQDSFEPKPPIVDEATGKILSTPENAIQNIPPDGIILKTKPL